MGQTKVERILVTVDDEHVDAIQSVAAALRSAGMQVSNVMTTTGIITGEVPQDSRQALAAVRGVKAVEPDEEMRAF